MTRSRVHACDYNPRMPSPLRRLLGPRPPRALQRDTVSILLDDGRPFELQRVRDPRAKRIRLSIDERGARLTLPPAASLVAGDRFLQLHRDWLAAQLAAHDPGGVPTLERDVTDALPLRGGQVPLLWRSGRFTRITTEGGALVFHATERASAATLSRALKDFYEGEARADIGRWLPKYLPHLPRAPSRVRLRTMSSQWGSLAPDGAMSLDLSLVLAPRSAFEYVVVHELCHLIHADHSPRFWAEVERRCPDWRDEREWFHAEGRRLKARLHGLLSVDAAG